LTHTTDSETPNNPDNQVYHGEEQSQEKPGRHASGAQQRDHLEARQPYEEPRTVAGLPANLPAAIAIEQIQDSKQRQDFVTHGGIELRHEVLDILLIAFLEFFKACILGNA